MMDVPVNIRPGQGHNQLSIRESVAKSANRGVGTPRMKRDQEVHSTALERGCDPNVMFQRPENRGPAKRRDPVPGARASRHRSHNLDRESAHDSLNTITFVKDLKTPATLR